MQGAMGSANGRSEKRMTKSEGRGATGERREVKTKGEGREARVKGEERSEGHEEGARCSQQGARREGKKARC